MLRRLRGSLSYSNVMATVAVFVALGGGAYAAFKLPRDSVRSKHIVNGQVRAEDLASGAAVGNIVANALGGAQINEASLVGVNADKIDGLDSSAFASADDPRLGPPEDWQDVEPQGSQTGAAFVCHASVGGDCTSNYANVVLRDDLATNPAGYFKDREIVHLRGFVRRFCHTNGPVEGCLADGRDIFQLPPGYRPAYTEEHLVLAGGGSGNYPIALNLLVETDGMVSIAKTPASQPTPISLDGVSFRVDP